MIIRKVKSIYGGSLNTRVQAHKFNKGEVKAVKFLSIEQYNDVIMTGQFEVADNDIPSNKEIISAPEGKAAAVEQKTANVEIQINENNASGPTVVTSSKAVITNEDIKKQNEVDDNIELPTCECGVLMIQDDDNWKCVACGKIKPIVEKQELLKTEESSKRKTSKCPKCGKRKRASDDICDKCKQTS